jgi:hypothetical protein
MKNPSRRSALLALLLAAPLAVRAEGLGEGAAQDLMDSLRAENANFCSASAELRGFEGVPCSTYGDFTKKDLVAATKAVFGEASPESDEQCAVALTIFNRARAENAHLSSIVSAPGQFEGYSSGDRRECVKLKGSVEAVKRVLTGGRCSFGPRSFKYFCSVEGWNRVKSKRKPGSERPEIIGNTAFLTKGPC